MKPQNIFFLIFTLLIMAFGANAQTYCFTAPEGHGAGVTGGGTPTAINTTTVTTNTEFITALSGSKSIIIVSGTLTFTSQVSKSFSNKTIVGLPGARLVNNQQIKNVSGILYISGGTNIIIRNLIFEGPGAYDVDGNDNLSIKGAKNVWVDHCEFQDGIDDCFDITGLSDNITVSWCKFSHLKPALAGGSGGAADHRFVNLVGGSDTDKPSDGNYSITWQNCWWADGNRDRMARGRNVQFHILNCYWTSTVAGNNVSLTSGSIGCTAYIEGSIYAGTGKPVVLDIPRNTDGTPVTPIPAVPFNVKLVDTYMANGTTLPKITMTNGATNLATLAAPTYSYTVFPSNQVVAAVTNANCGAGATLQVTTDGVISSSCTGLSTNSYTAQNQNIKLIQVGTNLTVTGTEVSSIAVFNVAGAKMASSKNSNEININSLSTGFYIVEVKSIDGTITSEKIIKK